MDRYPDETRHRPDETRAGPDVQGLQDLHVRGTRLRRGEVRVREHRQDVHGHPDGAQHRRDETCIEADSQGQRHLSVHLRGTHQRQDVHSQGLQEHRGHPGVLTQNLPKEVNTTSPPPNSAGASSYGKL